MSESQPFIEHFYELRRRLAIVTVVLLLGASVGYFLRWKLLDLLVQPLKQPLYYTTPGGGFDFIIKLCLFFGVILATPVAVSQLFLFLQPIIDKKSTRFIRIGMVASVILLIFGVLFGYFVTLPAALHFLHEFSTDEVRSLITTNEYFSFVMIYLAGFGLLFQLPIIVLFINRIKPLKPQKMLKNERWVVLISFLAAAIITPTPDPMNQIMMAAPIILLYNLSLVLILLTNRGKKQPVAITFPVTTQATVPAIPTILQSFAEKQPVTSSVRPAVHVSRGRSLDGFSAPRTITLNSMSKAPATVRTYATVQKPQITASQHTESLFQRPQPLQQRRPTFAFDVFS